MSTKLFFGADEEIYFGSGQRLLHLQKGYILDLVNLWILLCYFKYHRLTINAPCLRQTGLTLLDTLKVVSRG